MGSRQPTVDSSLTIRHPLSAIPFFRHMHRISIKAVLLATLAVFGIDMVTGLILIKAFNGPAFDATPAEIEAGLAALNSNGGYMFSALVLGTASTVVGGFLTARLAPALPFYNALMFGIVNLILGLPFSTGLPTWFRVVAFGLLIPAALAGAYWSKWASQPGRRQ